MKDSRKVLFISDGSSWSTRASEFLEQKFSSVDWFAWDYGLPKKRSFDTWDGCDILLSFKADFIIPDDMLERVSETALNFHPSLPDYRGIGGYRYAIDEGRLEFGATCHMITPELDAGPIIEVSRFPIHAGETEAQLMERTAKVALNQFMRVASELHEGYTPTIDVSESWGERLYTRAALEAYRARTLEMTTSR
jgi:hypothetical protein